MDGYDDGYGTQQPYPPCRCFMVDGSGRVVPSGGDAGINSQRIVYTSRQPSEVERPRTQVKIALI